MRMEEGRGEIQGEEEKEGGEKRKNKQQKGTSII